MLYYGGENMNRVRAQLHADEVHAAGFTGNGITAAVLDSGK